MPGRRLSAQALQAARLRARRAQRAEGLSRRRRALAAAVRYHSDEGLLRQDRLPPRRRRCSARRPGCAIRSRVHNFYVPAGGDEPDPADQSEIRAQARRFSTRCATCTHMLPARDERSILVGDLNVAPLRARRLEPQADARGRVAHADRMREAHRRAEGRRLDRRRARTSCREPEKLYTWWSYRSPDWAAADKGRRLDHIWVVAGARRPASRRSRSTKDARGWERPSDHVPVTATLDV